jgi:hypothetical protein
VPILLLSRLEASNKNARFTIGRFETAKFVSLCPRNLLGLAVMRGCPPFSCLLCQAPNDMLGIDKELNDHRKSMGAVSRSRRGVSYAGPQCLWRAVWTLNTDDYHSDIWFPGNAQWGPFSCPEASVEVRPVWICSAQNAAHDQKLHAPDPGPS